MCDGINWYSYCGGNPVKYIDPSGNYYIKKYGDNYKVTSETITGVVIKGVSSYVPFGGLPLSIYYDLSGIRGGNSSKSIAEGFNDGMKDAVIDRIIEKIGKEAFKDIMQVVNIAATVVNAGENLSIYDKDKIAIELFNNCGDDLVSKSVELLDMKMKCAYNFIETNNTYFSGNIINGKTLYEIDLDISQSGDRFKTIKSYANNYISNLVANHLLPTDKNIIDSEMSKVMKYFSNYKNRLETVNTSFSKISELEEKS